MLPQYYQNDLQLVDTHKASLQDVLAEFRQAIAKGVSLIRQNVPLPSENDQYGTIYNGGLGISSAQWHGILKEENLIIFMQELP